MAEQPDDLSSLRIDRSRAAARRHPRRRWAIVGALLLLATALAVALLSRAPTVSVVEVRQAAPGEAATELTAAGYVAAERRSIVAPKAAGRLERVLVSEGDRVAAGQTLALLDQSDARIAAEGAEAAVQAARATLSASRAQAVQAQRALGRAEILVRGGAISREAWLDAVAARDTSRAQRRAAAARLEETRRALAAARQRLADTTIRAPFAGTVARKLADEGAVLAPAAISETNVGGILELVDLGSLYVEAEVSEDQLGRLQTGQPALIFLDAFPDRVYRATTGAVRPTIDKAKATAVVKVLFEELSPGPLPDMGAKVSFLEKPLSADALAGEPRLRVPASAVVERDGGPVVLTVREGRAEARSVQVAGRVGREVALRRGPAPGTKVIAAPGPRVRAGSRVRLEAPGP